MSMIWVENTVRTSGLKCGECKEPVGTGKIAIVFENGKSKRLCEQCGKDKEEAEKLVGKV